MLVLGFWSAIAQVQLKNRPEGAGESTNQIINQRFSLQNALTCTKQIDKALSSFRELSKLATPKLTKSQMRKVGNTDWEIQNLGFVNWVGAVEGTLRKQNYQIAKLQLEIARMQSKSGKLSTKALQEKQTACRKAEKDFQRFCESFSIAD